MNRGRKDLIEGLSSFFKKRITTYFCYENMLKAKICMYNPIFGKINVKGEDMNGY